MTSQAAEYNAKRGPSPFLCQSSWRMIDPGTEAGVHWVKTQQRLLDLEVDGKMGPATTREYVRRYGPLRSTPHTFIPIGWIRHMWGYDHVMDDPEARWPKRDPGFLATLDDLDNDFIAGMLKLLTGFNPRTGEFNRWPRSIISLDTISVGCFHYWAKTLADHLPAILDDVPGIELLAFQTDVDPLTTIVTMPQQLEDFLRPKTGKMKFDARLLDFAVGWRFLMTSGVMTRLHCQEWADGYIDKAWATIRHFGWMDAANGQDGARILALVTRMQNSGAARSRIRNAARAVSSRDPLVILKHCYHGKRSDGLYQKPNRWRKVMSWPEFTGPAPRDTTVA